MYEIDLGSGQNHTDTVSWTLSRAPLKFRNILKQPLLLKSHDWHLDTRPKSLVQSKRFTKVSKLHKAVF